MEEQWLMGIKIAKDKIKEIKKTEATKHIKEMDEYFFTINNKKYRVAFNAYWHEPNWFSCAVEEELIDGYYRYEHCIKF